MKLPLYKAPPVTAIEAEECLDLDRACKRCSLHEGVRTPCLGAEGTGGGLLLVGEGPGKNEDQVGRPFIGKSGQLLRQIVAKHWRGPVAIDNATRCAAGAREVKDRHVEACRGYLAQTIEEARPTRIIALGAWSAYALTGRSVSPYSSRRAYTHLVTGAFGPKPIPLFFVIHPAAALRNRFVRGWLEADMAWALTTPDPPMAPLNAMLHVVDASNAAEALADLRRAPWVSFDVETAGIIYTPSFRLLAVSFCAADSDTAWVWGPDALKDPTARAALIELLADPRVRKLGANVKYDEISCDLELGVKAANVQGDVRLWRKLLEPEAEGKLDKMVELVGMGGMKEEAKREMASIAKLVHDGIKTEARLARNKLEDAELERGGKKPRKRSAPKPHMQAGMDFLHALDRDMPDLAPVIRDPDVDDEAWLYALVPQDILMRYNARDTVGTTRLAEWLAPQLAAEPDIDRVRRVIVDPAASAIRAVERWGVPADRAAIMHFDRYLELHLDQLGAKIDAHCGSTFNPNSPDQVAELLFKKLHLMPLRQTSKGYSTDDDTLESLKGQHPIIEVLSEWRSKSKMRGNYASGMLPHVRSDGRIHPSILLDGARSGRTSCSNPNLQNIPRAKDSVEGMMARNCFVAKPGFWLLQLDYSQLELRVAAFLSGDPLMLATFASGVDFHQRTAELISKIAWGIEPSQVESKHRSLAKAVNFGILYGKTAKTLAAEWGVPHATAQRIVDAVLGQFKVLAAWCEKKRAETQRTGQAWTWWDGKPARRRPLWRVADENDAAASNARNSAVNTPIQGTASEFCIASIIECVSWIEDDRLEDDVQLVLPVHDSLLFHVRRGMVDEVAGVAKEIMTGWNSAGVELTVDIEDGAQWGALQKRKAA